MLIPLDNNIFLTKIYSQLKVGLTVHVILKLCLQKIFVHHKIDVRLIYKITLCNRCKHKSFLQQMHLKKTLNSCNLGQIWTIIHCFKVYF